MPRDTVPITVTPQSDQNAPQILIVEDQPNTADMLTSYFEAQGYNVDAVGWGEDALDFVEETLPDLVVLDIRLPDIDGYEVCRQLRNRRRTKHVPIIFLTEKKKRGDKLMGLELGAVDYITKPFDVQELRLRVRNVLRRSCTEQPTNPITGLPTASISNERLRELLDDDSAWAMISIKLQGLKSFSETYGFVARDDVVRAVALILNHIVKEDKAPDAFVGHMDASGFLVIVGPHQVEDVQQALRARLDEAMSFFYPYADQKIPSDKPKPETPRLRVEMGVLKSSECSFDNLKDLKKALGKVQA